MIRLLLDFKKLSCCDDVIAIVAGWSGEAFGVPKNQFSSSRQDN